MKRLEVSSSWDLGSISRGKPKRGFACGQVSKRLVAFGVRRHFDQKSTFVSIVLNLPLEKEHAGNFFVVLDSTDLFPAVHDMGDGVVTEFLNHGEKFSGVLK